MTGKRSLHGKMQFPHLRKMRRFFPEAAARVLAALLLLNLLTGCSESTGNTDRETGNGELVSETSEFFLMDTWMTLTVYGYGTAPEEALKAAKEELTRLEELFSTGKSTSEISLINENGEGTLSEDTAAIVEMSLELYERTDGAFDITIYPLMKLWGFTDKNYHVPDEAELQPVLAVCGSGLLDYDPDTRYLRLSEGQGIDLGAIAKGYASNRLIDLFEEYGIVSGVISLGGNVQLYGSKPDGSDWNCGIVDPFRPDDASSYAGILSESDKAIITSGTYERNFTDSETGITYHHIMDPATGMPAESGIVSATVVSADGMLADGLTTALFVLGEEKAIEYWKMYGEDFDMVLVTEDARVLVTEGIADRFTSDYPVTVISR